jgi:hypothetical protein
VPGVRRAVEAAGDDDGLAHRQRGYTWTAVAFR